LEAETMHGEPCLGPLPRGDDLVRALTQQEAQRQIGFREKIEANYHKTLTAALNGPHAAERAALVLSLVAGVQVMRQMIALPALADARPEVLTRLLTPIVDHLLEGMAPRARTRRQR
jgi:hypothetical protein